MKAILLAGGHGIRLRPLTSYTNKHLLPVYHKDILVHQGTPIIEFGIYTLATAGIKDVAIVLGDFRCEDIFTFLKDGSQYGMNFSYYYQGEPLGIAQAVTCAKDFVDDEEGFLVYLGDNFFGTGIKSFVESLYGKKNYLGILFAKTKNPERFGCPIWKDEDELEGIQEKPKNPKGNFVVSGCYYFNTKKFFEEFDKLEPSARGEYELSDLMSALIKKYPENIHYQFYRNFWSDAGTFESIQKVENYLRNEK